MTHPPGGDAFERLAADAVTALALRKVCDGHHLRLRFCFEVAGLRDAVKLASELRRAARSIVRVHPGTPRSPHRRLWIVALTTPPSRVGPDVIRRWGAELRDVARRHDGCRLVGLRPILAPARPIRPPEPATGRGPSHPFRAMRRAPTRRSMRP